MTFWSVPRDFAKNEFGFTGLRAGPRCSIRRTGAVQAVSLVSGSRASGWFSARATLFRCNWRNAVFQQVCSCRYAAGVIDFQSGGVFARLGPSDPRAVAAELAPILVDGEAVHLSFKGMRDSVVFTNKRLIAINVQGLTGKKRDYSSLPYSKIQAWSIETAGRFDLDAELELWFSGLGRVRLDFKGQVDIRSIGQLIGQHVL